jgi:hypothetical protein
MSDTKPSRRPYQGPAPTVDGATERERLIKAGIIKPDSAKLTPTLKEIERELDRAGVEPIAVDRTPAPTHEPA